MLKKRRKKNPLHKRSASRLDDSTSLDVRVGVRVIHSVHCTLQERDPAVQAMKAVTEEGKKVARMGGEKYWAVFRQVKNGCTCRVHGDLWPTA